jgi:hypothetical protein
VNGNGTTTMHADEATRMAAVATEAVDKAGRRDLAGQRWQCDSAVVTARGVSGRASVALSR